MLLEHTAPGGIHLDWLIERTSDASEHRLIAFRCDSDPFELMPWTGERIPDHRAKYLDFEGDIGGGRGSVRRLWSRPCRLLIEKDSAITLLVSDGNRWLRCRLAVDNREAADHRNGADSRWFLEVRRATAPDAS